MVLVRRGIEVVGWVRERRVSILARRLWSQVEGPEIQKSGLMAVRRVELTGRACLREDHRLLRYERRGFCVRSPLLIEESMVIVFP